jgi:DNA-3-methyladenine glycosylase II
VFFQYGETEINFLKNKDKKLGKAIDRIGHINREVNPDLFSSLISSIIGQQISTKAHKTILERMYLNIGKITEKNISKLSVNEIQAFGMTFKKAEYIKELSTKIKCGELDLAEIKNKPDNEIIYELTKLRGVGRWTVEMLLIFCLQRPDVLSYQDLAIIRGLRMLYRQKEITKKMFEKYKRRYSPYGSVASLYLWSIAGGAIEELKDCR